MGEQVKKLVIGFISLLSLFDYFFLTSILLYYLCNYDVWSANTHKYKIYATYIIQHLNTPCRATEQDNVRV